MKTKQKRFVIPHRKNVIDEVKAVAIEKEVDVPAEKMLMDIMIKLLEEGGAVCHELFGSYKKGGAW